nr:MAG TPA: hypothetical protein [Caudoviricetes sp.]
MYNNIYHYRRTHSIIYTVINRKIRANTFICICSYMIII